MNKSQQLFADENVRIRQLQRLIGAGSAFSGPIFSIIILAAVFSMITNYIVGQKLGILPAALGVLTLQSIIIGTFLASEKYDQLLARSLVLLYVAYYTFIVLAVQPDYNILFTAMLGFPPFTVLVMGSREGTVWSLATMGIIVGGATAHGYNSDFDEISLSQIIFVLFQTLIVIMFVYVVDIVARRYAAQLIDQTHDSEESEARYDVLLDSISDGLVAVDRQGVVQFVNKAARDLTGLSDKDLEGSIASSSLLLADEKGNVIRNQNYPLHSVLSNLETTEINQFSEKKYYMVRENGTSFPVGMTITAVQVDDDNIGALMLFYDLTKINDIEKAKSEFVSLASHQLRTPLNVVSWYSEKLIKQKKGPLNDKQMGYIETISENNRRMISLVTDLLNVSRVDVGRVKLKHEAVEVIPLTESLIKEISPLTDKKHINFSHVLPRKNIILKDSDEKLLTVIIQNLLSNAVKYTKEHGDVDFTVRQVRKGVKLSEMKNIVADEDGIIFAVQDNGVGIPDDDQDKIFGKLYRAENVQTMDVEGTGLGLYVTRSFVEEMGGQIWFESVVNKGTTFFVFLKV